MRIFAFILLACSIFCRLWADNLFNLNGDFNGLCQKTKTLSVRCFAQDSTGLVWFGTSRGLYSYDGYDMRHYISDTLPSHQLIKCSLIHREVMLLGGENGITLFNLQNGQFSKPNIRLNESISSFCEYGGEIWIGAESGLYIYNVEQDELRPALIRGRNYPRNIQSLATDQKNLYIGMTDELGCYSFATNDYQVISHPDFFYVSALFLDSSENTLWIGSAQYLHRMNLETRKVERVRDFYIVKSIAKDNNNLLIGTDDGLYVRDRQNTWHLISHDARNSFSLSGNVVNMFFKDESSNIWIGTDNGISLVVNNSSIRSRLLSDITASNEGCQISSLLRTADSTLWLGGSRGLIKLKMNMQGNNICRWYQMNSKESFIPHNCIRALYEDSRQHLWVASDRGLLRYNPMNGQFISYLFDDLKNWVYDILETPNGDLWLATFCGVYGFSSEQSPEGGLLKTKYHFTHDQGLYSNDIYQLALDRDNNLWVLSNNHHIDRINLTTNTILPIEKIIGIPHIDSYAVISDSEGNIWVSTSDSLLKLSVNGGNVSVQIIPLGSVQSIEVFAMDEGENEIWLTTSEGLFMVEKEDLKVHRICMSEKYIGIFHDPIDHKIWLGTSNKVAEIDPMLLRQEIQQFHKVKVTGIEINGNEELCYTDRQSKHIQLAAKQNNLRISFSDYQYKGESLTNYAFKLDGYHAQWMELDKNENFITLYNLPPGNYALYIASLENISDTKQAEPILRITITPPWYLSWYACLFYFLITIGIVWWILRFIIMRQQLRKERELKNCFMEQAKSKIDLFTNIAHEFKSPLSLILAPSSKLLSEETEKEKKALLELIYENAKKLGSLIHFTIEAYRDREKVRQTFISTEIEFVEFARSIFNFYRENMKSKQFDFIFDTNREHIYTRMDIFKMESILNNLLTNACKFTSDHGSIILSLECNEQTKQLYVKVADTGVGIPEEEIPFVFQRYYQSSRTIKSDKEGTGIGLAIVKEYVEMHGGNVLLTSNSNGTTVQLIFPINIDMQEQEEIIEKITATENKEDTRPLIAIVEDNASIAGFINNLLSADYRCVIAQNGKNGLKLCIDLLPDLIIADVMMPVMNGIEMCRNIREHMPLATIPIILLTAKNDSDIEYQSALLGIDAFIAKPFDSSLLVARIKQLLGNKKRLEQQMRIEHIQQPELKGEIPVDEKLLFRITATIEEHIDNSDLSVEMLSQLIGISQKQLYRKIKSLTGMSTVEYIRSIRLKKAALLFHNGNFTVAEVMYMVGFSNASYFTRCFVAEFGKTPMEYLRMKQE